MRDLMIRFVRLLMNDLPYFIGFLELLSITVIYLMSMLGIGKILTYITLIVVAIIVGMLLTMIDLKCHTLDEIKNALGKE
jgi:uncharacterized protein involved in cysteine biosynthesis